MSPLLANIYLHRVDEGYSHHYGTPDCKVESAGYWRWQQAPKQGKTKAATPLVRYADDWISTVRGTKNQAQELKEAWKDFLQEELGLELSEEKTTSTHSIDGFDFLGDHIFRGDKPSNGTMAGVFMHPREKGFKRIKQKLKDMTGRKTLKEEYLHK